MNPHTRRYQALGITLLIVTIVLIGLLIVRIMTQQPKRHRWIAHAPRIAVIEVEGPILDSKQILEKIQLLSYAKQIKGVVLRINSPGGAVGPSQEIYEALDLYRKKRGVMIYASLGAVAASGGYWIALVADQIYANAGTLTGSIGAVMELVNLEDLFDWMKIKRLTFKAGKYKDLGNAARPITPEERKLLNNMLAEIHDQFKEKIVERRGLDLEALGDIAQGQVFTGQQAQVLKLVDHLGGFAQVVVDLREHLGLPEDEELYYPSPPRSIREFLEKVGSSAVQEGIRLVLQGQQEVLQLKFK